MTSGADASSAASKLSPGETIAGKFRVERIVGAGGMGIVVEALNIQLDRRVALKFLRQDIERSPALVARFEREVRSAVKLRSEHVARVSDVGTHPSYGPFMVMELLVGSTLAELLAASGPVPMHRAVEYVIHACEGLAEAHVRGIVHQDVKPANLFLVHGSDGRPLVKVLDFGISKATLSDARAPETTTGRSASNMGTPHYLSPEQLRTAKDVDLRADVWALGCVLFELVTGEKAFRAERFTELVAKILEAPRAAIPEGLEIPAGVIAAIDRCLEKDRAKRYATTAELGLALLPFARRRAHAVASRAVAHVTEGGLDPHLTMPSSMPPRPSEGAIELESSPNLRAPGVPRLSLEPEGRAAPSTAPPLAPPAGSRRFLLVPLFLLLVAGVGAGLLLTSRQADPVVAVKPETKPSVSIATAAIPSTIPSSAAATASAASSAPSEKPAVPSATRVVPWSAQTARPALSVPTPSPPPRSTDTEIRNSR